MNQSQSRKLLIDVSTADFQDYIRCQRQWVVLPFLAKSKDILVNDLLEVRIRKAKASIIGMVIEIILFDNVNSLLEQVNHNELFLKDQPENNPEILLTKKYGLQKGGVALRVKFKCPNFRNKFVITGGPGFGKSTLLNELDKLGYRTFPEAARMIIDEQKNAESPILPWIDRLKFDEAVIARMIKDYEIDNNDYSAFYDRGFPDLIGWRKYAKLATSEIENLVYMHPYEQLTFLTQPWKEIYVTNEDRPYSFSDSVKINKILAGTYEKLGYAVEYIPNATVQERVDFILNKIEEYNTKA
jgi:predicted ATPase